NALFQLRFDGAGKISHIDVPQSTATQMFDDAASPTNDHESALLLSLASANYTAIVRRVNGTTGVALAEAYQVQ
ncbi:MAG TPA: hypothetical protein VHW03_03970, partial [Chthoniobacterales bacterium]|nr:hypothetical protein [Chthoniobacterales bacterium]